MSLITFPLYAHHFTPREYGLLDLLTLAGMIVGWTVALEIYQAVGRLLADERDPIRRKAYTSTALWFSAGAYLAFAVVAEVFSAPISHVLLGPDVRLTLFRVAVVSMAVNGFLMIPQAQLRWQLRPVAFAIAAGINAVLTVVGSLVLVFGAGLGVEGMLLGSLIGSAAGLIYVLIATAGTFGLHFDAGKCREMLAFSAPLVPSSIGVFLNLYADRLVIQHLRSVADVGVYGAGYRLAMIVSLLLTGVQGATLPLIFARKDESSTPADLAQIFRIFSCVGLSAFVVLSLLATPTLRILAAPAYQRGSALVPFLVMSVLFAGMYMFAVGLPIAKKTVVMATSTVCAGAGNLVLALLLVPGLGILGAGIATATTSFAWFVVLMVLSDRYYPVPHDWRSLILAFVAISALTGVALAILPDARAGALDPDTLAIRAALVIIGVAIAIVIILGNGSATRALSIIRSAIPRPSRAAAHVSGSPAKPAPEGYGGSAIGDATDDASRSASHERPARYVMKDD